MSNRPLNSDELREALNFAGLAEAAAEDVARAHNALHVALNRYADAAASLGSLVPHLRPHILVQRVQTIRKTLNRAEFGDLSRRAREVREGVDSL